MPSYPAIFIDENGDTRIAGTVTFTDPANQPAFSGGTITSPLVIALTDPAATALTINLPVGAGNEDARQFVINDEAASAVVHMDADGTITGDGRTWGGAFSYLLAANRNFSVDGPSGTFKVVGAAASADSKLGFFGTTPAVKPTVTGAKLPSDVALASLLTALAALGLITNSTT